jgi:hypothetical protein
MKGFINKNYVTILTYIKVILISVTYFIIIGLSLGLSAAGMNDLRMTL